MFLVVWGSRKKCGCVSQCSIGFRTSSFTNGRGRQMERNPEAHRNRVQDENRGALQGKLDVQLVQLFLDGWLESLRFSTGLRCYLPGS